MLHRTSSLVVLYFVLSFVFSLILAQNAGPCSALYIPGPYNNTIVRGNTFNATASAPSSVNCFEQGEQGVAWYTISSPTTITVDISTCNVGTEFDTTLFVSVGACSALTCMVSNDDFGCEIAYDSSKLTGVQLAFNTVYYIGIGGYGNGQFTLTINDQVFEDTCLNAKTIPGPYSPPVRVYGTNQNAASGYFNSECALNPSEMPIWYIINPSVGLPVTITTCGANTTIDSVISVFSGSCSTLTCVAYNDDYCSNGGSQVTFTPALTSYLVAVSGYGTQVGYLATTFSQSLPTSCSSPLPISVGTSLNQQIVGQPTVVSDPCNLITGEPGYWFVLNGLAASKQAIVSTCSFYTNYDTTLVVYSGSCSALHCVGSNDDATCVVTGSTITSQVSFTPAASTTYYAVVSGYGAARGTFVLTLEQ